MDFVATKCVLCGTKGNSVHEILFAPYEMQFRTRNGFSSEHMARRIAECNKMRRELHFVSLCRVNDMMRRMLTGCLVDLPLYFSPFSLSPSLYPFYFSSPFLMYFFVFPSIPPPSFSFSSPSISPFPFSHVRRGEMTKIKKKIPHKMQME